MTRRRNPGMRVNDHPGMRRKSEFADREVEALLRGSSAGPGLSDALSVLRLQGTLPAPAPTAALTTLLNEGFTPSAITPARPSRRRLSISLIAVGASSALLLTATGANALPASGQRAVAGVLNALTPFDFPLPNDDQPPALTPAPVPLKVPEAEPTDEPTEEPSARATEPGDSGDPGESGREGDDQPVTSGAGGDSTSGEGSSNGDSSTTSDQSDTSGSGSGPSSPTPSDDGSSPDSPSLSDAGSGSSGSGGSSGSDELPTSDTP